MLKAAQLRGRAPRVHERACCKPWRAAGHRSRAPRLLALSGGDDARLYSTSAQQQVIAVDHSPPAAVKTQQTGPPAPLIALAAAALAFAAFKRVTGQRGHQGDGDPFEREVLRNVNMVPINQLSDDAIAAARARRSRESAYLKMDLEEVELPDNHPWAVRRPVTKEQEDEITARLQIRRGPSRRDPAGRADAEQAGSGVPRRPE